jgi:hypothetical protein
MLWFHNNQPLDLELDAHLQLSSNGQRLQIGGALVSDSGVYRCIATNEAGEADQKFDLQVWGKFVCFLNVSLFILFLFQISFVLLLEYNLLDLLFFSNMTKVKGKSSTLLIKPTYF